MMGRQLPSRDLKGERGKIGLEDAGQPAVDPSVLRIEPRHNYRDPDAGHRAAENVGDVVRPHKDS